VVCGAAGMLGRDVTRSAAEAGHEVVALSRSDLDVTDVAAAREAIAAAGPDVVLNCAAYTDVDGAESDPDRALLVNGEGAGNVAGAAAAAGADVIYVSSDYVFDGTKGEPYQEDDEPAPLSSYGRSKLEGERRTLADGEHAAVVRSSWLFGVHGRNFVDSMLRAGTERDELRVVDDQVGCPTWTGHLAPALLRLGASGSRGVYHLAGGGQCSWYELAREIVSRAGLDCRVEPCTTAEFPRPAPRPAYSVLRTGRGEPLPPWGEGLDGYLAEREAAA
jgi:dTDP-4-dehydrorhamnose reductase